MRILTSNFPFNYFSELSCTQRKPMEVSSHWWEMKKKGGYSLAEKTGASVCTAYEFILVNLAKIVHQYGSFKGRAILFINTALYWNILSHQISDHYFITSITSRMHRTYVISEFQRIGKIYTEHRQAVEPVDRRILQRWLTEFQLPSS